MNTLLRVVSLVQRLEASAALVRYAAEIVPRLIERGHTSDPHAQIILGQIPKLFQEVHEQFDAVRDGINALQDRIEIIGQFLLLHRAALTPEEAANVERMLAVAKGEDVLAES